LAGSACAASVTVFDGSAVTQPSNASGKTAFGEGGSVRTVADFFSAAVGCPVCTHAKAAPHPIAVTPQTNPNHRIKKLTSPGTRSTKSQS
jgi:hypothetical protein